MTTQQQDQIMEEIQNQPLRNFGNREISIVNGSSREIDKVYGMHSEGSSTFSIKSDEGKAIFYFNKQGEINFVG